MISEQTIRTVISICEGWQVTEYGTVVLLAGDNVPVISQPLSSIHTIGQYVLDALAAEARRRIPEPWTVVESNNYSEIYHEKECTFIEGPDRTANTLNAIAEFVEKYPDELPHL